MKLLSKMKKMFMGSMVTLSMLPSKLFAATAVPSPSWDQPAVYGPPNSAWDMPSNSVIGNILYVIIMIFAIVLIPITFIIGVILFFKKSKLETKYKVLITLGILLLLVGLYFIGSFIMNAIF